VRRTYDKLIRDRIPELVKELADVLEVMEALLEVEGVGWDEVREVQEARRLERGGYARRLWLRWTEQGH